MDSPPRESARLKQGRLTEHEQQVAHQLVQAGDLLMIDDGSDLTAEDVRETAPHMEGLALVVVDRLQAAHSARLPLSGDRLPDSSQVLATLARTLHVPVLAIVDSDDPALLGLPAVSEMPDTHEGHRLAAALRPFTTPMSADTAGSAGQAAAAGAPVHAPADSGQGQDDVTEDEEDGEDGLAPGDEEDEPEGHVFPALKILKDSVGRSKMHPIPVIRTEARDSAP
ncbi:DnaB-like helicase C-terminal domain-containing protein [Streptomyces sp. NPDC047860]|uniref:DnaB-like helicase C-terminal domain-containing protein n=1 Tax=Streptomyces sp. NPDC047860 TaxID=3155743 RepID=UPI0033C059CB